MMKELPCQLYRGGTSKGVFFDRAALPAKREDWDELFLKLMGSPDPRQIDGLGGSFSTTSKIAVIEKANAPDYDIDYTFAQVSVDAALVSYAGNCGNISSAVGPYAIENRLVPVEDGETVVRIRNTNTNKIIHAHVRTPGGQIAYDGDCRIAGVPTPGSPIRLEFLNPAGSVTGKLLPTGHAKDVCEIPGFGPLEMSIVDVSNPLVFIRAADVGLTGTELPPALTKDMLALLETIRGVAACRCGFISDYRDSLQTPGVPKTTIVSPAQSYMDATGYHISGGDIALTSRMMSMQKMHNSYAFTGSLCTAAAAAIPGTLVNELTGGKTEIVIGHPGGTLRAGVVLERGTENAAEPTIQSAYGIRTALKLMVGTAYIQ